MKITIKTKKPKEQWHDWFAWYPVFETEECEIYIYFLQTIKRNWIPSQGYGHYGNFIYKAK